MGIKKGDTVKIMVGKDNGKTGKVIRVDSKKDQVTIEGLNLFKKHVRPKRQGEKGEIVSIPRPMPLSRVMILCSSCNKPVRIGYRLEKEKKVRYCRKCKSIF